MTAMRSIPGLIIILVAAGCGPSPADSAAPLKAPAEVEGAVPEGKLATITLTPKAEERLGIRKVAVERKTVGRTRMLGGEVIAPPGAALLVSAPLSGTLGIPAGGNLPGPGSAVKKGEPLFTLLPLLSPESRVNFAASRAEAEGDVRKAEVELNAAQVAYARAEELLREKAGSVRAVDEGKARLELARATLRAAEAKREALNRAVQDLESGLAVPISLESPLDGVLQDVRAAPGQVVPAGAVLFEVLGTIPYWIRLPVYVGDLAEIETGKDVHIGDLAGRPGSSTCSARPVTGPPSADPDAATVNLFFKLPRDQKGFRPGQKVGVTVSLKAEEESLVVPWSSVIHDIQGGTWVYEATGPQTFLRRRIQVRHVVGDLAVLGEGPAEGSLVVTDGAAELFGTEFGIGK